MAPWRAPAKRVRLRLLDDDHLITLELAPIVEVTTQGNALAVDGGQAGVELLLSIALRLQGSGQVPILSRDERHALTLALDDDAGSNGLHAADGQARHDLLPQNRGHLVAVEAVKDAAGFLGIDEVLVELTGVFCRLQDGGLGDLVEDHSAHRDLGLENLEQVPSDGFALAVRVCCEVELIALLQLGLEVCDLLLFLLADDVQRGEVVLRVHAEAGPGFLLVLRRDVSSAAWKIADVPHGGFNNVFVA